MIKVNKSFWCNKKVLITGHTGFKGSWLCLWLHQLGAKVTGFALKPPTEPNLFHLSSLENLVHSVYGDIRNFDLLYETIVQTDPDIIFHMAAQPLVGHSYENPVETYEINVMGTTYLLEAVKKAVNNGKRIKALVNVTTDKCYENKEWHWGYRENDRLGGYDPYSISKACSELITDSYRKAFFNPNTYDQHGVGIATARAGNVIGGGDWAAGRLIPDCTQALLNGKKIVIRNPKSIRPWQHVLEPLYGYLLLAEKLYLNGTEYAEAWNFGPKDDDAKPVEWIVQRICEKWGGQTYYELDSRNHPHEASYLKLDYSKAKEELKWSPKWTLDQAIDKVIEWVRAYSEKSDIREVCFKQIKEFSQLK
ncbi:MULTISPECIES: CDP-glucose 4,6-dehydratase [Bacillaceae]|uniref:CDP-glucose 4,6-dehydratase n=1 Tax=Bacillaceae TaxID=186817 RepID=UPI0030001E2F